MMCTGSQWRERVVPRLYDRSMIQRHGAVLEAWESGLLPFSIIMAISSWNPYVCQAVPLSEAYVGFDGDTIDKHQEKLLS